MPDDVKDVVCGVIQNVLAALCQEPDHLRVGAYAPSADRIRVVAELGSQDYQWVRYFDNGSVHSAIAEIGRAVGARHDVTVEFDSHNPQQGSTDFGTSRPRCSEGVTV
jgi:hypothetical protein